MSTLVIVVAEISMNSDLLNINVLRLSSGQMLNLGGFEAGIQGRFQHGGMLIRVLGASVL
jgi:hypothetical protein